MLAASAYVALRVARVRLGTSEQFIERRRCTLVLLHAPSVTEATKLGQNLYCRKTRTCRGPSEYKIHAGLLPAMESVEVPHGPYLNVVQEFKGLADL